MIQPEEITNEFLREMLATLVIFIPDNEKLLINDVADVMINLREGKIKVVQTK